MTRKEVEEKMEAFMALLDKEQALKEELLALQMYGRRATDEEVADKLAYQDDLVEEVNRIRMEEMLPILEEMMAFVASKQVDSVAD